MFSSGVTCHMSVRSSPRFSCPRSLVCLFPLARLRTKRGCHINLCVCARVVCLPPVISDFSQATQLLHLYCISTSPPLPPITTRLAKGKLSERAAHQGRIAFCRHPAVAALAQARCAGPRPRLPLPAFRRHQRGTEPYPEHDAHPTPHAGELRDGLCGSQRALCQPHGDPGRRGLRLGIQERRPAGLCAR
jgi:hypothetical protein